MRTLQPEHTWAVERLEKGTDDSRKLIKKEVHRGTLGTAPTSVSRMDMGVLGSELFPLGHQRHP